MKECPFCKEDNMSKAVYCCMCGKQFPQDENSIVETIPANNRFVPFGESKASAQSAEDKPVSRFKPM